MEPPPDPVHPEAWAPVPPQSTGSPRKLVSGSHNSWLTSGWTPLGPALLTEGCLHLSQGEPSAWCRAKAGVPGQLCSSALGLFLGATPGWEVANLSWSAKLAPALPVCPDLCVPGCRAGEPSFCGPALCPLSCGVES